MNKALFLDRDGVLILDKGYVGKPEDVELIEGVGEFLSEAKERGYLLFLFSNQSGIGRGYYTMDDALACTKRMLELLGLGQDLFQGVCLAPESPEAEQVYRKPSPRFINEMIERFDLNRQESWMIGDKMCDLEAGIRAEVNPAWVATGKPLDAELKGYIDERSVKKMLLLSSFWD